MTTDRFKNTGSVILPVMLLAGASFWLLQSLTAPQQAAGPALSAATYDATIEAPELITIPPRTFEYRDPARYIENELPQISPLVHAKVQTPLNVAKNLVTNAQYRQCVLDAYCPPAITIKTPIDDHPVVGINYEMAEKYAAWLSAKTGENWRLPTALEWAQFAGEKYDDPEKDIQSDPTNPAVAWLSEYRAKSKSKSTTPSQSLRPAGLFGANSLGINDVAENVWVWTSTCYERINVDATNSQSKAISCGARVVEGAHRTYLSVFISNPQGGGCTVGDPPDHLGIRLVKGGDKPDFFSFLRRLWPFGSSIKA
ncbi:formylglycine-generating enzyme required for sulfatase activity [Maritalea mobilis]|uniref:Formylglycine-generating enzyme required for sulfatase activity n=1 Tax=Maritalea mobilis TaxID=483324 RepID=A0A4R6VJ70_9HYPH|nr:SUMF1/EgtB/PvdO family nonheme iron enzyme [Maritalea mobilis]TDQ61699.1 formylglycine-generating enzyme required for sulfatase activity [Maritalea mobilis]